MSTLIRFVPVAHATKRTTAVAMENDGVIRTRVEDPGGTATDRRFNFASLVEGQARVITEEPVTAVTSEKIGADARFIFDVTNYYDSTLTGDDAPSERFLWYAYTVDEKDAPADTAAQAATPSNPLYFVWTSGGTPASPTVAFNFPSQDQRAQRQWVELGTLAARRHYLKGLVLDMINHPNMAQWLAGGRLSAIDTTISQVVAEMQSLQILSYYPEMLTRAISVDHNLATERPFNILEGMAKLDLGELHTQSAARHLAAYVASTDGRGTGNPTNRDLWIFQRIGDAAASSPFAYTRTDWTLHEVVGSPKVIDLNGSNAIGTDWQAWLRT